MSQSLQGAGLGLHCVNRSTSLHCVFLRHGANVMCSVASLEANHFVFLMFAFGYVHGIQQLEGHVLKAKCGV